MRIRWGQCVFQNHSKHCRLRQGENNKFFKQCFKKQVFQKPFITLQTKGKMRIIMTKLPKFLIVEADILPEVFLKVVIAKQLLAQGKAKNSSEAAKLAGVSRSAYYKYRDSVYTFDRDTREQTISLSIILTDEPGVLSGVLTSLYETGANIVTVNQNIPSDGVAVASISAKVEQESFDEEEFLAFMKKVHGVVDIKSITGR